MLDFFFYIYGVLKRKHLISFQFLYLHFVPMENNKNKEKIGSSSRRNLFDGCSSDQNRANWSADDTKLFLEFLVVEKNYGNWSGKSPTSKGYENIINSFQQQMMITFNRKQLKTKHESLRNLFHLWSNMFNGQTGAGFNIATGGMIMDSSWWDNKIKENNAYQKFRDRGLENAALMYQVYGDNSATGAYQYTPTAANPMFRNSQVDETEDNDSSPPRNQYVNDNDEVNSPVQTREDSGRSRLSGGKRKSSSQDAWSASLRNELRQDFGPSASTPLEYTIKHVKLNVDADSTNRVLDILYGMDDLEPHLKMAGIQLTLDESKKITFLGLRTDADRRMWLQYCSQSGSN